MQTQTQQAGDWWARSRGEQSANWIANYQSSLRVRHRDRISEIVGDLQPHTLLEVGCHCGPNLVRLAQDYPGLRVSGVEANAEAVEAGRTWASRLAVAGRVELAVGRFPRATDAMPSGAFDVVLSCYTLAYIAPADLDAALYEMGRLAARAVILAEPQVFTGTGAGKHTLNGYQEWHHHYQDARRWVETLRTRRAHVVAVEPPVDALNAILVLTQP